MTSKDGPRPLAAFWHTMKPKPSIAKRACLMSQSFIKFHSSGAYLTVKVGPNHFGRFPPAAGSSIRSFDGWAKVRYWAQD